MAFGIRAGNENLTNLMSLTCSNLKTFEVFNHLSQSDKLPENSFYINFYLFALDHQHRGRFQLHQMAEDNSQSFISATVFI